MAVMDKILEMAKADKKRIILPETNDDRVLKAAAKVVADDLAEMILIGDVEAMKAQAEGLGVDISGAVLINPAESPDLDRYAEAFYELRKSKGVTLEEAKKILSEDSVFFGIVMVRLGDADGLVSGAAHTTADTLRPALQIVQTAPDEELVSSFFIIEVPNCDLGDNGVFLFADCGLNQDPPSEQLAIIADQTSRSGASLLGMDGRVAFISHSTMGSASHALVDKVVEGLRIAREKYPDLKCDGEMQVDAAIVPEVGKSKAPDSEVAGQANILVFPNIDVGNSCYKIAERFAGARAIGPILQGLNRPVNDLSRGCKWEVIPDVVAITAVQAQIIAAKEAAAK